MSLLDINQSVYFLHFSAGFLYWFKSFCKFSCILFIMHVDSFIHMHNISQCLSLSQKILFMYYFSVHLVEYFFTSLIPRSCFSAIVPDQRRQRDWENARERIRESYLQMARLETDTQVEVWPDKQKGTEKHIQIDEHLDRPTYKAVDQRNRLNISAILKFIPPLPIWVENLHF